MVLDSLGLNTGPPAHAIMTRVSGNNVGSTCGQDPRCSDAGGSTTCHEEVPAKRDLIGGYAAINIEDET